MVQYNKGMIELKEKIFAILNELLDGQKSLENGQKKLEIQVTENTQILKALEHASQVNKAEIDKRSFDMH